MRPQPTLDQQINQLMQQLPLQRLQLKNQTNTLTCALRARLSSPKALAVATVTGALLTLWLQGRESSNAPISQQSQAISAWDILYQSIWLGLWRPLLSH